MRSKQIINWPAILARLDNVSVVAGVSPVQRLNELLDPLGQQVLLDAEGRATDHDRNKALHYGLSCVVIGAAVLSRHILESHEE